MAKLHILILSVLPICFAQFSIQGPSDGNRAAQGLSYSEEKGIEYTDQKESSGTSDFSIQGATDGNSNFQIQGASDGNADFQIQGPTDGNSNFQIQGATDGNSDYKIQGATDGNANFQVQGPTDGNYQSTIQGPYDVNQGSQRSLQYNDPNGFKLNWRSYAHGHLSPQQQPQQQPQPQSAYTQRQPEPQYEPEPAPRPAPRPAPQPAAHQSEPDDEPPQQPINYRPYTNVPSQIKQLIQFQSQIPYLNAIPEHLRYESLAPGQPQHQAQQEEAPQEQPQRASAPPSRYRSKPRDHQRSKRQTQQKQAQQQQQQQQPQQQYRRIPQPAAERLPQYSSNVPSQIKQLIQFQSQIPYLNAIPEQFRYNLNSPPTPVQPYQSPGVPQPQSVPRASHQRSKRQAHQQRQQQQQQYKRIPQPASEAQPQYSTHVPSQIKQLLQFQSQIPYVNAIPEQFRYNLENVQHASQNGAQGATPHQRGKRDAQQHQGGPQQQYKRISQPAPEVLPQYSNNLPSGIQQILQFQAQTPYNIIANQITYRLDKPYVPERVSAPISNYQGQSHGDVKPVTEHK